MLKKFSFKNYAGQFGAFELKMLRSTVLNCIQTDTQKSGKIM